MSHKSRKNTYEHDANNRDKEFEYFKDTINALIHCDVSVMDSKVFMSLYDTCFKLCVREKEHNIIKFVCKTFIKYRNRQRDSVKIYQQSISTTPFTQYKDIKNIILDLLIEDMETSYYTHVAIMSRVCSYLDRDYIPTMRREGKYMKINGKQYEYKPICSMLTSLPIHI